jgi:signal transduction histidine kinase
VSADTAIDILGWVNAGAFALLGLVSLRFWLRRRDRPSLWAALCFGALGAVFLAGLVLPEHAESDLEIVLQRLLVVTLLLFPYFLYRFTAAFTPKSRLLDRGAALATIVLCVWTVALPDFPEAEEPRPSWFVVYIVALLVDWAALSLIAAGRLWVAGRGLPSVARHRMQMLSFAASAMTVALFLAGLAPESGAATELATSSLAFVSAFAFILGLSPPGLVRIVWRRPEQDRVRRATGQLMAAKTPEEVTANVLPAMSRLVGARAVALLDADGNLVGSHGATPEVLDSIHKGGDPQVLELAIPGGSLLVWTSPHAPFFGTEEIELLQSLGALAGLALDRSRLFVQEREARAELERADEMKTNFIALAAHELRTPVTSVHGVVATLDRLGDQLSGSERAELDGALRTQTDRLRRLVEQLLDLSRLEAEAVPIHPVSIPVRAEVEGLVEASAVGRVEDVEVQIDNALEATVDRTVLERVVSNLLSNALRHGDSPILVTAERRDRHFRLAVQDQGSGVPAEFVDALFERFSRSDDARARGLGSGLGLSIALSYARAHGGDLLYEPVRPHGARFEFVVPDERSGDGQGRTAG